MSNDFNLSKMGAPPFAKYILIILPAIILIQNSFVIVDAGRVGVIKKLGAVQPIPFEEGFHLKTPFIDTVIPVNIRLNNSQSNSLSSSKDLQNVQTTVSVQYSINADVASQTYQKIGLNKQIQTTVIQPAIGESVKAVTAKYTAEELITLRESVKLQIHQAIQLFINTTLTEKKIANGIKIANVAITDFNFSDEFNRAIELKVNRKLYLPAKIIFENYITSTDDNATMHF